jgi:hypothetical protein
MVVGSVRLTRDKFQIWVWGLFVTLPRCTRACISWARTYGVYLIGVYLNRASHTYILYGRVYSRSSTPQTVIDLSRFELQNTVFTLRDKDLYRASAGDPYRDLKASNVFECGP